MENRIYKDVFEAAFIFEDRLGNHMWFYHMPATNQFCIEYEPEVDIRTGKFEEIYVDTYTALNTVERMMNHTTLWRWVKGYDLYLLWMGA